MANPKLPPSTPLDVRMGLTSTDGVGHRLRWGILGSGRISAQWVQSLREVSGAEIVAVAAREQARAQAFADAHNIPVIEDAAQSVGSKYKGKLSGSIGDVGCFSTHPLKNLNACGDGGF